MKKLILVAFVALIAFTANSQVSFGVRGGLDFQNMNGKMAGKTEKGQLALKYNLGVDAEIGLADDFYLQPGLLFTTKGFKDEDGGMEFKRNINYLEVPVNFLYKPLLGDGNLIVAFGPYLAYAIGGKDKMDVGSLSSEESISFGSDENKDDLKPMDMGINISFGYMMSSKISFQLNTQLGLVNLLPGGDADNSIKNTGFGLSVGYRF